MTHPASDDYLRQIIYGLETENHRLRQIVLELNEEKRKLQEELEGERNQDASSQRE